MDSTALKEELEKTRAERDKALSILDVLHARVEDALSMMTTDYVRDALDGGTARSVAEYVRQQYEAGPV